MFNRLVTLYLDGLQQANFVLYVVKIFSNSYGYFEKFCLIQNKIFSVSLHQIKSNKSNWKSLSIVCVFIYLLGSSNNLLAQPTNYIEKYQEIAIREMHRSGIPASITLAQGILESSWGNGSLALKANNHFGIKCKSHWTGPSFYIEDDDFKNGKLIKSCFRSYDNAKASYIDHTDFLIENPRYQKLFSYDKTDYKRWAHGLKKCGYATDKKYAYKLISNIEKYNLSRFDLMPEESPVFAASPPVPSSSKFDNNTITNSFGNNPSQQLPEPERPSPQVFVLPQDYKRGDGIRQFGTKGNKKFNISSSILLLKR